MTGSTVGAETAAYAAPPAATVPNQQLVSDQEAAAIRQVEWYLSRRNLATDYFLLQQLDSEYWVDLATLAGFPKMVLIGIVDLDVLARLLIERSVELQLRTRPNQDLNGPPVYQVRPVYAAAEAAAAARIDPSESIATLTIATAATPPTKDQVDALLVGAPASAVELRTEADGAGWVATFQTADEARLVHDFLKGKSIADEALMVRVKVETRQERIDGSEDPASHVPGRGVIYYPYPDGHLPANVSSNRKGGPAIPHSLQNRIKAHTTQVSRNTVGPRKQLPSSGRVATQRPIDGKVDINRLARPKQPRSAASTKAGARAVKRDSKDTHSSFEGSRSASTAAPVLTETQFPPLGQRAGPRVTGPSAPRLECNNFAAKVAAAVAVAATTHPENSLESSTPAESPSSELDNDTTGTPGDDLHISITSSLTPSPTPSERTEREAEEVPACPPGQEKNETGSQTSKNQPLSTASYASAVLKQGAPAASPTSITREASCLTSSSGSAALVTQTNNTTLERLPVSQYKEDLIAKEVSEEERKKLVPGTRSVWSNKPSSIFQAPPPPKVSAPVSLLPANQVSKVAEAAPAASTKRTETTLPNAKRKATKSSRKLSSRTPVAAHNSSDPAKATFVRAPSPPPPVLAGAWAKGSPLSALSTPNEGVRNQTES